MRSGIIEMYFIKGMRDTLCEWRTGRFPRSLLQLKLEEQKVFQVENMGKDTPGRINNMNERIWTFKDSSTERDR